MGSAVSTFNSKSNALGKFCHDDNILPMHSPSLLDLGHGTIRHRHIRLNEEISEKPKSLKTSYFYHPKLEDYSEGARKDQTKNLYYVYGTNVHSKDPGVKHVSYKPQGKGYKWPESFRKSNNLYYDLIFLEQDRGISNYADTISLDSHVTLDSGNTNSTQSKDTIRMTLTNLDSAETIKRKLAVKLLVPAINIHITFNRAELRNEDVISDLRSPEEGMWRQFSVLLRLT
ncbi:uncharacterized protein LOC124444405 isoform X2 [Xenia sp. Carnegie-2017]|uniref:uncharacterized protein LOC124444405 isoform X2 n=1 Tax=Xenia sp. Carnegie-2017 TaxID=2897299 RepID=UPI001F03A28A|nr:uncharacterized protein LOC124444405 isoform X2 [Xenia sp. Carnegie-2017]